MADLVRYKTEVAWFTKTDNLVLVSRETEEEPAVFKITVKPIDTNNIGAGDVEVGYTFTDWIGTPYKIVAISGLSINIQDIFRVGCPVRGKIGLIHKSAYKGFSVNLPSELLFRLHKSAASNNNKYSMSILWANDPNGRRIPFENVSQPSIANYREDVIDSDGVIFNMEEDYGQNPQFEIWQLTEEDVYSKLPVDQQITYSPFDGKIDSVLFSGTGEEITGYILIKN